MVLPLIPLVAGIAGRAGVGAAARGITASSAAKFGGKALAQGAAMRAGGNMVDGPDGGQRGAGGGGLDFAAAANQTYTSLMQPGQFG